MLAFIYLFCLVLLAGVLQSRVSLLADFRGMPRFLLSLGLTLFGVCWADFLLYVICGWGLAYSIAAWLVVLIPAWLMAGKAHPSVPLAERRRRFKQDLVLHWRGILCFLFLAAVVLSRFYMGLDFENEDLYCNFNFIDTAFHLSVSNAFVFSPRFPPMDLDMPPYPLKYHFLADFFVAHLLKMDMPRIYAVWYMNILSATVLVGALWAVFERWLKLSARWVLLAALVFLLLNPAILNLLHYGIFRPDFFNPDDLFDGLLCYPFFNFEAILTNMLEPQRGFLFTLPVALLILHAYFGDATPVGTQYPTGEQFWRRRSRLLQAGLLICLLPLAHINTFAVLSVAAIPGLWTQRRWLLSKWRLWGTFAALCLLQLAYIFAYMPPPASGLPTLFLGPLLPHGELTGMPRLVRRTVFWLLTDGDFLGWGLLLGATAIMNRPLRQLLAQWKWYFFTCAGFFLITNFYSSPFVWGDNNKFIVFLNLGLTLVIIAGAAQWSGGRRAWRSHILWWFFFALCIAPHAYEFYRDVYIYPKGKILLFQKNGRAAARWLRENTQPDDWVLSAAINVDAHFVTALSGRPTPVGIYGFANLYHEDEDFEPIRRVYEEGALDLLPELGVRYVCLSRVERRKYKINRRWDQFIAEGRAVAFHSGEPGEFDSVYIFDVALLPKK